MKNQNQVKNKDRKNGKSQQAPLNARNASSDLKSSKNSSEAYAGRDRARSNQERWDEDNATSYGGSNRQL